MSQKKNPHHFDPDEELLGSFSQFLSNEEEEEGGEGSGSQTGQIEFKDFLAPPKDRDDLLPPEEIKRLLIVHKETHKEQVKKQKQLREERAALKEGKKSHHVGQGMSQHSALNKHPLSKAAQFSGVDKQVNGVPNLSEVNTNLEKQDELQNRLQNRLANRLENRMQNTPRFNPRPRGPGGL